MMFAKSVLLELVTCRNLSIGWICVRVTTQKTIRMANRVVVASGLSMSFLSTLLFIRLDLAGFKFVYSSYKYTMLGTWW